MKKSLRQLVLVGLSATLLAGVAAPSILAQDDDASETTEQMEESTEEATETMTEEMASEASHAQAGVDEAIAIFQNEYPEAHIEEIDVELDREDDVDMTDDLDDTDMDDDVDEADMAEEVVYNITINGFDADDNDYELEIEWVNGEIREQGFDEGLFNSDDDDEAETTEDAEDVERRSLDLENLVTLDEATEIAIAEYGEGEITHWNLTIDDPDWFEFWAEGYENPIWTIEIDSNEEGKDDEEIRIDAVTGDIINLEDINTGEESMSEEVTEEEVTEEETTEE